MDEQLKEANEQLFALALTRAKQTAQGLLAILIDANDSDDPPDADTVRELAEWCFNTAVDDPLFESLDHGKLVWPLAVNTVEREQEHFVRTMVKYFEDIVAEEDTETPPRIGYYL